MREIVSLASHQAKNKGRKLALSANPKFSQKNPNSSSLTHETSFTLENATVKSTLKLQMKSSVLSYKQIKLDIPHFVAVFQTELSNTVRHCPTKEDPSQWKIRSKCVKKIRYLIKLSISSTSHLQ